MGNLTFTIKGKDKVLPYLYDELSPVETSTVDNPDILFNFNAPPEKIADGIFVPPAVCSQSEMLYRGNGFRYHVKGKNKSLCVTIQSNPLGKKRRWAPKLVQMKDRDFLHPVARQARNFMYRVFDYITQIKNTKRQQSYFHGSSFAKKDQAVAVIGWGGVGKSTSVLKLVTEDDWQYLSDDLGIIDHEGYIYRLPKKVHLSAFSLEGQPILKNLLPNDRGLSDKLNWYFRKQIKGINGVKRRISAKKLFGRNKVAKKALLTDVFFIEREDVKEFNTQPLAVEALAIRAATTIMKQINPYHRIETALYTAQEKAVIPRYNELYKQTAFILTESFSGLNTRLITIPLKASPDELTGYLRQILS
jgi:hypothetical protein